MPNDRTITDALGIRHRLEHGADRNTRCGVLVQHLIEYGGDVNCMACVGGPSLLSIRDLKFGIEVQVWLQLFNAQGVIVGDSMPVMFSRGQNDHAVSFTGLTPGTLVVGHRYQDEDSRTIWISRRREPIVVCEGDEVILEVGGARII